MALWPEQSVAVHDTSGAFDEVGETGGDDGVAGAVTTGTAARNVTEPRVLYDDCPDCL